jgi:hypothetical protein
LFKSIEESQLQVGSVNLRIRTTFHKKGIFVMVLFAFGCDAEAQHEGSTSSASTTQDNPVTST